MEHDRCTDPARNLDGTNWEFMRLFHRWGCWTLPTCTELRWGSCFCRLGHLISRCFGEKHREMQELGTLMEKVETGFYGERRYLEKGSVGAWLVLNGIFRFYCVFTGLFIKRKETANAK